MSSLRTVEGKWNKGQNYRTWPFTELPNTTKNKAAQPNFNHNSSLQSEMPQALKLDATRSYIKATIMQRAS